MTVVEDFFIEVYSLTLSVKNFNSSFFIFIFKFKGIFTTTKQKIEKTVRKFVASGNSIENIEIILKYAGESNNITKSNVKILNFTFTLINDKQNCKSSKGNFILRLTIF